ncbi:MAG: RNA-binding protein [Thermoprotei archaeon]|nr:MAG: RNA-binding protein [Thermoprotei archaeon]
MRKLGTVLHITPSNLIVVRSSDPSTLPPLGSIVVGADGEAIGRVVDIIGRVDSPYIVVKPLSPSKLSLVSPSTVLFYRVMSRRKGRRGRRSRR